MAEEHYTNGIPLSGDHLEFFVDPTHGLTIDDVHGYNLWDWRSNEQEVPSFGFSHDTYWFRFVVPGNDHAWLLEINYALLDEIEFYRVKGGEVVEFVRT
ncbi:7TM-DISM domain-containing protein, partial [Oleiphilus sp. HI0132]